MSKTWEHYHHAARHHEKAAYHHKEAAKYDQAEEHERPRTKRTWLMGIVSMQFIMRPTQRNCTLSNAPAW